MSMSEDWLKREDAVCFEGRVERLNWIAEMVPEGEYGTFHGSMRKYLFEEVRYCFVYAQFLAVIVLGLAFLETTFAACFYAAGRNDLERASISELLCEAKDVGWLTESEHKKLDQIRLLRNPVVHFRPPLTKDTIEYRAYDKETYHYSVIEQDARDVIQVVMHIHEKILF